MPYGEKCEPLSTVSKKIADITQFECHVTLPKRNSPLKSGLYLFRENVQSKEIVE